MKHVIGVTGGYASGKSTVISILKSHDYDIIDCDELSHKILNRKTGNCFKQIVASFGSDIVGDNGSIDRKKLGGKIFGNNDLKKLLESILHPVIYQEVLKKVESSKKEIVFIDCPLLFEHPEFKELCCKTILVYCNMDNQIARAMKRDNLDFVTAITRIRSQMSLDEKKGLADYIVDNDHDIGDIKWQVEMILERLGNEL